MSPGWEEADFLMAEIGRGPDPPGLPPVTFTQATLGSPAVCIRDPRIPPRLAAGLALGATFQI